MIDKHYKRFTQYLEFIGFSPYEAKAYIALLIGGEITPMQLAKLSGVPGARTYDILDSLEQKGFCISHPGGQKKYVAVQPKEALPRYLKNIETHFQEEMKSKKEIMMNILGDLSRLAKQTKETTIPIEYIWTLKEMELISRGFANAVQKAEKSVKQLNRAPYAPQKIQHEALLEALKKGINVQQIFHIDEASITPEIYQHIQEENGAGAKIKFSNEVHAKVAIIDDKEVWMPLLDVDQRSFTCLIIRHPYAASLHSHYFDLMWEKSESYTIMKTKLERWLTNKVEKEVQKPKGKDWIFDLVG